MKPLSDKQKVWETALDWLFRLHEDPDNQSLADGCRAWQMADPEHARAWQTARQIWLLTGVLPTAEHRTVATQETTTEAVVVELPEPGRRSAEHWRKVATGFGMAACLLLTVFFTFNVVSGVDYRTGRAETLHASLADGTTLTLAANTRLDIDFTDHQRTARLHEGAVFFDVVQDSLRPFIVQHGSTRIEVLGTAFEVMTHKNGLKVQAQQGSVWVQDTALPPTQLTAALQPGEMVKLDYHQHTVSRDQVNINHIAAWRQGQLVIRNQRIDEVVRQLNQHYQGYILLQDETLAARRISGVFDLHDPKAALTNLVEPYDAEIKAYTPWLLVVNNNPYK